jgi:hypothetical protein
MTNSSPLTLFNCRLVSNKVPSRTLAAYAPEGQLAKPALNPTSSKLHTGVMLLPHWINWLLLTLSLGLCDGSHEGTFKGYL